MKRKFFQTLENFTWQQWLLVALFLLVIGFTGLHTVRAVRSAIYWSHHRNEPLHGWMTVGYVAHSYRVPRHVLYQALGLPERQRDRRTLRRIAKEQNKSVDEIKAILQNAITLANPQIIFPSSPSPSPAPTRRGAP